MKDLIIKNITTESILNPILYADLANYMQGVGIRKGSAPTRSYMQHRSQNGYTRVRQTKSNIIAEWVE